MKEFSDRFAALSPAQRALLELTLKKKGLRALPQTIPKRLQENHCPLSLDQERLWFIQQLDLDSPAYNIYSARRFKGTVNVAVLTACLNEVMRRHEIMRTSFTIVDGLPVQVIAPRLTVTVPLADLRAIPVAERETEAARIVAEELRRPFDLTRLPVFRTLLIRVDDDDYICPTVFHHIITDWISFQIFERELAVLYESFLAGEPSPLPEPPLQYADFAVWQRQWMNEQAASEHLDYWRQKLSDAPLVLELPMDRPRRPVQNPWGVRQPLVLSKAHSNAVRVLAQQEEVTLFMFLLAVFKLLLFRLTSQEKIIVGSPVALRHKAETQELLGFFLNHLVFCTDLSGDPTFREVLHRVRHTSLEAYAHQDMPFGKLVDALQPQRDLSRTAITQVVFLFLNTHQRGELKFPGFTVLPYWADSGSVDFDMTFSLWDSEDGFNGWLEYNTDLFDAVSIMRMAEHFRNLVAGVITNPDLRLSELPMLTEAELHQLLVEWAATEPEASPDACVAELFEAQVERTPDAVALIFGKEQITYRELNQRANRVAHHLQALGVGPEAVVGILMGRNVEVIVGLLGVVKAGAAYLLLDPTYPSERLAFIIADAGVSILLTQTQIDEELLAQRVTVLRLETEAEATAYVDGERNPVRTLRAQNLAYVIYTSGSTGKPKGVGISQGAAARHFLHARRQYELRRDDCVLQFASFSFDASLEQIFPSLLTGAKIFLRDDEIWSQAEFIRQAREQRFTVINLPPVYWYELVKELDAVSALALARHLRLVIVGGDSIPLEAVSRWQKTPLRAVRLLNAYGPTEATITSMIFEISSEFCDGTAVRRVPIGRPFAGRAIYILDENGEPVPIGVTGEIHIGGSLLARSYLNSPALTAERFIPDRFGDEPGGRLYKTGDLARYLPNGYVEFIGRRDHQVKVRGFRIEMGEVEAALLEHPAVREAVVIVPEEMQGDKRLIAYITVASQELGEGELREYMSRKLPRHMVPAIFVILRELPLTIAGKIDRRALPPPDAVRLAEAETFVAPRTSVEQDLAEIWRRVLGVERIGIHDNFFDLGGDSIRSIRIVVGAAQKGIRLTPRQIFQHQTIADLAAAASASALIGAEQGIVTGQVPLTPIQQWFFEKNLSEPHHFNQALLLEAAETVEILALEKAVQHLLLHHDALRLRFVREGFAWGQEHANTEATASLIHIDLSGLPDEAQSAAFEVAAAELQARLELTDGPLARFAFFSFDAKKSGRLLIIIHHLVVDVVSWRILLEDLQTGYLKASLGEKIELPPKTTSFKHWSERVSEYARSDELEQEARYWTEQALARVASFPVDHPEGANTAGSADTVGMFLNREETQTLLKCVGQHRTRLDSLLLAALMQAYKEVTGQLSLLIHLEGHGREEIIEDVDVSRTVGWFTTICPIVLRLQENSHAGDALRMVEEQLGRIPLRGFGYGLLKYLRKDRDLEAKLQALSLSDVSFNYLGHLDHILSESSLFRPATEQRGPTHSPNANRIYLLDVVASISNGQLQSFWTYSGNLYHRATIERLASEFIVALKAVITHCTLEDVGVHSRSHPEVAKPDGQRPGRTNLAVEDLYPLSPAKQSSQTLPLRPVPRTGALRLSMAQEQLWMLDQLLPNVPLFNIHIDISLSGHLNVDALARSFKEVVRRHESLRTTFAAGDEGPVQIIAPTIACNMPVADLSALSEESQEDELWRLAFEEVRRPFDLSRGPLLRLTLLRLSMEEYRVMFTIHHIVSDAWAIGIFVKELTHFYEAFHENRSMSLPELTVQYGDFAFWQRQWLGTEVMQRQLNYWRNKIGGRQSPLNLPTDYPRSEMPGFRTSQQSLTLSPDLSAALKSFSRQETASLFMSLLAAFQILLYHYTRQEDIKVGTLVANRNHAETERLIGLFVNTVVIRTGLSSSLTYRQLLHQVRATVLEAFDNQDLPFEQLAQALEVEGDLKHDKLFEVLFVMQNAPLPTLELPGLKVSAAHDDGAQLTPNLTLTTFDLILMVSEGPHALTLSLTYKSDLFRETTIDRMLKNFQSILETVITNPEQQLSAVWLPFS